MTDTSGLTSPTPFAVYDPGTCSWRTCQGTFLSDSEPFSATWPRSGTTQNGAAFERPMSARRIAANVSSLLPTPAAPDGSRGPDYAKAERSKTGMALQAVVGLLPTPTAADARRTDTTRPGDPTLPKTIRDLLPTPTANQPGETAEGHLERKRRGKMNRANPTVTDLGMVVSLLPTPTANDATGGRNSTAWRSNPDSNHHSGDTLTDIVWKANGPASPPPSNGGSEWSDELLLPLWTGD